MKYIHSYFKKYMCSVIFIIVSILLAILLFNYFNPLFVTPIERFNSIDEKRFNYFHIRCADEVNEFIVMKNDVICCEVPNLYIDTDHVLNFNMSLQLKKDNKIVEEKKMEMVS
jgi:hypothetical protein